MATMRRTLLWTSSILYMGLIYYFSSLSGIKSPISFPFYDKVVHAIEYGILSGLVYFALRYTFTYSESLNFIMAFSITLFYGLSDELHQLYVPGRNCSGWDLIADGLGGCLFLLVIRYLRDKREILI